MMTNLTKKYTEAKRKANTFMKNGQIAQYIEALVEMNKYKRLITLTISN